jgi:hypothetical protein
MRLVEHMGGDGPIIFKHACKMELEGIVSKRKDLSYRSGAEQELDEDQESCGSGGAAHRRRGSVVVSGRWLPSAAIARRQVIVF